MSHLFGTTLCNSHLQGLLFRWIDETWAQNADLRTFDEVEGAACLGYQKGDMSGIGIPYKSPFAENKIVNWAVRRDNPDCEMRGGVRRDLRKYMRPMGSRNNLYIPPQVYLAQLSDVSIPIVIVEGELKAIALRRLADYQNPGTLRFIPVAISGVANWRATVGTTENSAGKRVSIKGLLPELEAINWKERSVILAFDADQKTNRMVRSELWKLSHVLAEMQAHVGKLEWDQAQGKGIDDWLFKVGPEPVLKALSEVKLSDQTGWRSKLICTSSGSPVANLANVVTALTDCEIFDAAFSWNSFSFKVHVNRPFLWRTDADGNDWRDEDDNRLCVWMQQQGINVNPKTCSDAVMTAAQNSKFHPIRDYLNGLVWDEIYRLDHWLSNYMGAEKTLFNAHAGASMLISAVARVMDPGCKVDTVVIFEGDQGIGKSTACRILGGKWYTDNMPDLSSKDAQQFVREKWIIELSELDAMSKHERGKVKAWATRQDEEFRAQYGRQFEKHPRQCIFVGSVNDDTYLNDETGGRRFYPVKVSGVDKEALARDRDQLWAEARHQYLQGTEWHITDPRVLEEAKEQQFARLVTHPWQEKIMECFVSHRFKPEYNGYLTAEFVLTNFIEKPIKDQTQADKNAVSKALKALSFRKGKAERGNIRAYFPPPELE